MRKMNWALVAIVVTAIGSGHLAAEESKHKAGQQKKAEKPHDTPGWIIVEEDVWFPLRFEPIRAINSVRYHYRRDEEKLAATEIEKSVSWLKLASGHAMPETKEKLTAAAKELSLLATDLREGKVVDAAELDAGLAKAAHSLAEWHFFKAKDSMGKDEVHYASHNLALAAQYLQHAANSAHYQFGPDTEEVLTRVYQDGKLVSESKHVEHDTLGKDLQSVEAAVKHLGDELQTISKP